MTQPRDDISDRDNIDTDCRLHRFNLPRNPDRKMLAMKRIRGIESVTVQGFNTTVFGVMVVTVRAPREAVEQIRNILTAVRAL